MSNERLPNEEIALVKDRILHYLTIHKGLKALDLYSKIAQDYLLLSDAESARYISELIQERKIKRIEYMIKDYPNAIFTFYLPGDSKIL